MATTDKPSLPPAMFGQRSSALRVKSSEGALTTRQTLGILALALTQFLLGAGPLWRHPWEPNASIVYSYIPLPFMVLACLLYNRRFAWSVWVFDTFRIVCIKFVITAFILVGLWATAKPPKAAIPPPPPIPLGIAPAPMIYVPEGKALRAATPISEAGSVHGGVFDDGDRPIASALVWISSGLEPYAFAPPSEPSVIENDGRGFGDLVVVQVGRPLVARARDHRLHTLLGLDAAGAPLFSVPILASGDARPIVFTDALGVVPVRCAVHAEAKTERSTRMLVVGHPFFSRTPADGSFAFAQVPIGALRLSALHEDGRRADLDVTVVRDGQASARLVVH